MSSVQWYPLECKLQSHAGSLRVDSSQSLLFDEVRKTLDWLKHNNYKYALWEYSKDYLENKMIKIVLHFKKIC